MTFHRRSAVVVRHRTNEHVYSKSEAVEIGRKLQQVREEARLSRAAVGKVLDVSHTAIYQLERGIIGRMDPYIDRLSVIYRRSKTDFLPTLPPEPKKETVPVLHRVEAGFDDSQVCALGWRLMKGFERLPEKHQEALVALVEDLVTPSENHDGHEVTQTETVN